MLGNRDVSVDMYVCMLATGTLTKSLGLWKRMSPLWYLKSGFNMKKRLLDLAQNLGEFGTFALVLLAPLA